MIPTPNPSTRRARISLFTRYLAEILSGVDPTNSKAHSSPSKISSPPVRASSLTRINMSIDKVRDTTERDSHYSSPYCARLRSRGITRTVS